MNRETPIVALRETAIQERREAGATLSYMGPESEPPPRRIAAVLTVALIAGLFLYCSSFGFSAGLGNDDLMNITMAWDPPVSKLALALIIPFTHVYRPAGSAVYRLLFDFFGLNPLPFRCLIYALLLVNLYLVYKLALSLSRSREIGALSALLFTFHGRLSGIYSNNGTLYDVLCATVTLLTLIYYVGLRERGQRIAGWKAFWFGLLFVCALNSKEMAAAIPLLLICYELTLRSIPRNFLPALACGLVTLLAAFARTGTGSIMHGNPGYAMTFTRPISWSTGGCLCPTSYIRPARTSVMRRQSSSGWR